MIRGANDGSELTIADVADVKDGFMEELRDNRFDRASSFTLGIFSLEGQNLLKISEQVQLYAEEKRKTAHRRRRRKQQKSPPPAPKKKC